MFGGAEQDIQLQPAQIWVHLTYQSAFVDDEGKLQVRRDVYNLDSRTLAAIKSERAIIETVPEVKNEQVIASGSSGRRAATPHTVSFFPSFFFDGRPLRPPRDIYSRRGLSGRQLRKGHCESPPGGGRSSDGRIACSAIGGCDGQGRYSRARL